MTKVNMHEAKSRLSKLVEMAKNGDDRLLDWEALPPTEWDLTEWQW